MIPPQPLSVLYRGGTVHTMDPARPAAEAVATRQGRIVAVGSEPDCRAAIGLPPEGEGRDAEHQDQIIDLGGRALLPGFIDAHMHPLLACFIDQQADLVGATTLDAVLDTLADRARITPPGEWVIGVRLMPERLAERRVPTLDELDAVSAGRPVIISLRDGHTSMGNTVALAAAGILGRRVAPPGGRFDRDRYGKLTGICREAATTVLLSPIPTPSIDELAPAAKELSAALAAYGVTSITTMLQTDSYGPAGQAGALESTGMMLLGDHFAQGRHAVLYGSADRAHELRQASSLHDPGANRLVGGIKMFLDGTLLGRTAYLREPYTDDPAQAGLLTMTPTEAALRAEEAHLAGFQVCIHATGDAANTLALDLFTELYRRHPPDPARPLNHRIEHATVLEDGAAERFAELGVVAVTEPGALEHETDWLEQCLGPDRLKRAYTLRTLVDAGATLAAGSDAPLDEPDPLAGIVAAVNRHGFQPAEGLTPNEAVAMYTRNAATAQGRDDIGTIAEGKRADLVVLSDDPLAMDPDDLGSLEVCLTVIGGNVVHRSWS